MMRGTVVYAAVLAITFNPGAASVSEPAVYTSAARARENAPQIFNAIHNAGRQWGSSVHHNGMGVMLAQVPAGELFYHGTWRGPDRFEGFEWLAFEVEHASHFARSWEVSQQSAWGIGVGRGGGREERLGDEWQGRQMPLAMEKAESRAASSESWMNDPHFLKLWRLDGGGNARLNASASPSVGGTSAITATAISTSASATETRFPQPRRPLRGYLHTYMTTRPINLLYVDGMAAAKGSLGALDSQDYLLLGRPQPDPNQKPGWPGPGFMGGDVQRASDLCGLVTSLGLDGIVRMEAGFEIIYCDFGIGGGLDLVGGKGAASPWKNETGMSNAAVPTVDKIDDERQDDDPEHVLSEVRSFEYLRAVAQRYHGHPSGRLRLDWGSVVSCLWYEGLNLTNPDPARQDLPRLVNNARRNGTDDPDRLAPVRQRVKDVVAARLNRTGDDGRGYAVDWQAAADLVVSRFATRLRYMTNQDVSAAYMRAEINGLLDVFIDYALLGEEGADDGPPAAGRESRALVAAMEKCTLYPLRHALTARSLWTLEDALVYEALEEVSRLVCGTLFRVRELVAASPRPHSSSDPVTDGETRVREARAELHQLMRTLDWSVFKECPGPCGADELCLIAMFPVGAAEDHFAPRCKNMTAISKAHGYWYGWPF